jgi:hypothetical protein
MNANAGVTIPLQVACLLLCVSSLRAAQTSRHLWGLREPDEIVEYDPITFVLKQTLKLPPQALTSPDSLGINNLGQMLFVPSLVETSPTGQQRASTQKI